MKISCDIAVIGSGFAGSLLAMIAKRLGYSVILLESGKHPRFAIGESSTPLANLLLEELSARYSLPNLAPLSKWGTWQDRYPGLAAGLKRGFSFFHHSLGEHRLRYDGRENQLLVAASPHNRIADVHWYRADLDHLLVAEAQKEGVEFVDEICLTQAVADQEGVNLEGLRDGTRLAIRASFVVDASGPRGYLHKAFLLPERNLPYLPATRALYTHFTGVKRFDGCASNNLECPPFAVDDAAVHHVFPGGWIWVLRFNNGITSAGVAAVDTVAEHYRFQDGAPAWEKLLCDLPSVKEQFTGSRIDRPFVYAPLLGFRTGPITGHRWALLPSAAGFVDPLLSTGFPLTLLGVARLAKMLEQPVGSPDLAELLQTYSEQTDAELLAASHLIAALYKSMDNFPMFSSLLLLYFAAASYSETARRLDKPELASSFLLHDRPGFGQESRRLLDRVLQSGGTLSCCEVRDAVLATIAPIDVAGLCDRARLNWYPVDAEDVLAAADKLQVSRDEIASLLDRSGFWEHGA